MSVSTPSPAERYAAAASRRAYPLFAEFRTDLPFEPDPFQVDACAAVERGENVLVCAPTGAGKTVVGEFAAHTALRSGGTCLYTTPIKALSNQKYRDLVGRYDRETVGLITGDTTVNPRAPIVVMTTEVLRNMLYAGSDDLSRVTSVVLDEIHYLADRARGAVWEEVIIHLPAAVPVIGLSATVSNAEEFGDWIRTVRGTTTVIVDENRPVPLWQHMIVGAGLYDLYAERVHDEDRVRTVNPALNRAIRHISAREDLPRKPGRGRGYGGRGRPVERWRPPPRPVVIERLDAAGLLPAIVFIFSRAGCDAAVVQCLRAGLKLTTPAEREEISRIIDRHLPDLSPADREVVQYFQWRSAWERGIAAHHAGLLPAFKEVVEELFVRGLIKVVFATETLSLGINMPARTVLLERLVKFDGESHADLTPGEYTQLTGRAGRRGIDVEGHAAVLWQPGLDPRRVAGLAGARTYPLRSSFRPTYNMVVNLVDRHGLEGARRILELSFAQFQRNRSLVAVTRQIRRNEENLQQSTTLTRCSRGDLAEYADLCQRLSVTEKDAQRARTAHRQETITEDLAALRRGDVIAIPTGRRRGLAVVLDGRRQGSEPVRPLVSTEHRWAGRVSARDFTGPIEVLGTVRLAKHVEHWKPEVRRDLASTLAATGLTPRRTARTRPPDHDADLMRRAIRSHPVHGCPDREAHLAAVRTAARLSTETQSLRAQVEAERDSMTRTLDRIHRVLTAREHLRGDRATPKGRVLQRVWVETDLLAVECLRRGLWRALDAPELAAAVSGLVFEARGGIITSARHLTGAVRSAAQRMEEVRRGIVADELSQGLPTTRELDFGFAASVETWARGGDLATAVSRFGAEADQPSAGDFVRWCRQVIDILEQLRSAGGAEDVPAAAAAVSALRRDLITWGAD